MSLSKEIKESLVKSAVLELIYGNPDWEEGLDVLDKEDLFIVMKNITDVYSEIQWLTRNAVYLPTASRSIKHDFIKVAMKAHPIK